MDVKHEVALAYEVTSANTDDAQTLPKLLDRTLAVLPPERLRTLAYDKAADSGPFHQALAQRGVKPVVQARAQWRGEPYRPLPGNSDRPVPICYDRLRLRLSARAGLQRGQGLRPDGARQMRD